MLTGEASVRRRRRARPPLQLGERHLGRLGDRRALRQLRIDDHAFPLFADPAANAREATAVGLGLSWYLSKTVRATFDYYQTRFETPVVPPAAPADRPDEQALITRFQVSF